MAARLATTVQKSQIQAVVSPVTTAAGFDLEDLAVNAIGRRNVVRIIVDRDGGVDLDAVAELSKAISAALDETGDGLVSQATYTLEVSSPGVDRPLTEPRHWRRNTGRLVRTQVNGNEATGRIVHADDAHVTLEIAGQTPKIGYAELGPGAVQVEFDRGEGSGP